MIHRRELLTLLGGTAAAWPVAARTQQRERTRRVGMLMTQAQDDPNGRASRCVSSDLDGKRQKILIEAVPGLRKMAALADASVTPHRHLEALQNAARQSGVELSIFGAASSEEIVPGIVVAKVAGAQALNLLATPLFTVNARGIIECIAALRLPAMHPWPEAAEDGGLLGYGPRFAKTFRQMRGARPADIPVEQPPNSSWSSISRPPRRSASSCPHRSCCAPTR